MSSSATGTGSETQPGAGEHRIHCSSCQAIIITRLADVGKAVECPSCAVENVVPLPRIGVAGGMRRAGNKKAQVAGRAGNAKPAAGTSAHLPVGAENGVAEAPVSSVPPGLSADQNNTPKLQEKGEQSARATDDPAPDTPDAKIKTGGSKAVPGPLDGKKRSQEAADQVIQAPPEKKGQSRVAMAVFSMMLVAGIAAGWMMNSGSSERTGEATRLAAENVHARLSFVIQNWQAARMKRESIENDLKITMAEMEAAGMEDGVRTVRQAIASRENDIAGHRNKALQSMMEIAAQSRTTPEIVDQALRDFVAEAQAGMKPQAASLAQRFSLALQQLPQNAHDDQRYFSSFWEGMEAE